MNTTFFYGLMLALSNIVLTLIGYFLGYQSEKIMQGKWFGLLPLVATIVVLWLGIRAVREEATDKSLRYGRGVGAGTLIALYGGLIGAIYTFIHLTFINPNFADYVVDMARQQWLAAGMGESQMATAEKVMRLVYKPAVMATLGALFSPLLGVVISLVLSAFLKRQPAAPAETAPPVM
ncbi:MAG: DUF4199 domain-containing protein [Opitutaceae bacterium]